MIRLHYNNTVSSFSSYPTKFETIVIPTQKNLMNITYLNNDEVVLKKFRGNKEVFDIYTSENRMLISSLTHSSLSPR